MKNARNIFAFLALATFLLAGTVSRAASPIKPAGYGADNTLVYERSLNASIGITANYSAVGNTYTITDANGKTVMTGTIRSGKTFYIPTSKLGNGVYRFQIGSQIVQQFVIK